MTFFEAIPLRQVIVVFLAAAGIATGFGVGVADAAGFGEVTS